jgi:hypothetical protein
MGRERMCKEDKERREGGGGDEWDDRKSSVVGSFGMPKSQQKRASKHRDERGVRIFLPKPVLATG